jgi:hypothetical protein
VRFSDRRQIEQIVDATRTSGYGVRAMIHAVVQSELFRDK